LPVFYKPIVFLYVIYNLRKAVRENNIDVVVSFLPMMNFINVVSGNKAMKILSARNVESVNKNHLTGKVMMLSHKGPYHTVAVSEAVKKDLVTNFNIDEDKISVIYNPVDREQILENMNQEIDDEYSWIFEHPTVVNIGRLAPNKNQSLLISSFSELKETIPDAQLIIIGDGPLENDLKKQAINLGLDSDVHFLGFQENPQKYLKRASAFVLPSKIEGLSNALLEAMVCGVPVITTHSVSGPEEILQPSGGLEIDENEIIYAEYGLICPQNPGHLCRCMAEILGDDELRKEYSARALMRSKDFDYDVIMPSWASILKGSISEDR